MIDFMIVGLPRSGTTWLANLFSTGEIMCMHDPLYKIHYSDWDTEIPRLYPKAYRVGVSCTGVWRWLDWLTAHPAPKLVVHRPVGAVIRSMANCGPYYYPHDIDKGADLLYKIQGLHVGYTGMFDVNTLRSIWYALLGNCVDVPRFDRVRASALLNMRIDPVTWDLGADPKLQARLAAELSGLGFALPPCFTEDKRRP